jgi:NADH-quinone oxidoreductase subunit E
MFLAQPEKILFLKEANTMPESIEYDDISAIIEKYASKQSALISILQEIQDKYRYLPKKSLLLVSEMLGVPVSQTYGVATFYTSLSLIPKGKHLISVCLGTACHVRGAPKILEEINRQLGIEAGETTVDKEFSLETVNCLGACALGPVVVVDGKYHGQMNISKTSSLLKKLKKKAEN